MNPQKGSFVPPGVEALEQRIAPAAANLDPSSLNGSNGFKISGNAAYDLAGSAVSGAGDVNGDGFADIIVNAPYSDSGAVDGGTSYVIFGKSGGFPPNLEASSLGTDGFQISNDFPSLNGRNSISGAGDINGDGFDDLIIGLPRFSAGAYFAGACFIVFGKSGGFSPNLNLSSLDGNNGFRIGGDSGAYVGRSVSGTGDINGDGIDDLIIGGPYSGSSGEGAAYVVFGSRNLLAASLSLASLDGANGFRIDGENAGDHAGVSVSGAGDINGDGFRDLIIGAKNSNANGAYSGASYVVFGKAGGFSASLRLSSLDGVNGFKINGEAAGDHSGDHVSGAGDVNGDGFDDLIIGAPYARSNGNGSGASYVVFGGNSGFAASLNLSSLNGSNGFKINGEAAYDHLGGSVSEAGDINGDEVGDLIIGARGASPFPFGIYSGAGYVIFGKSSGFSASLDLASLDGSTGFTFRGFSGYGLGTSVAGPGDINGDGFDDLLIGAPGAQPYGKSSGAAYVVFGAAARPTISISKASGLEGHTGTSSLSFVLTLSSTSSLPVSVLASTVDGTASSASDYTALAGELVQFAPGELTKTIVVSVQGDSTVEPNERFTIALSNATNADIANGTATGVIVNDDTAAATPNTITFQEADGDTVTIKLKGGQIAPGNISLDSDGNISVIDLTSFASLANAAGGKPINLSVSVKTGSGGSGNGLTKVGFLNATGVGLGSVSLQGDLGQIVAGDGSGKAALKSLSVAGNLGGLVGFSQVSRLLGQMSKLTIGGSIQKNPVQIDGKVKVISIGGDLVGSFVPGTAAPPLAEIAEEGIDEFIARGNATPLGVLLAESIAACRIGGNVKGGGIATTKDLGAFSVLGDFAGGLFSEGAMKSVRVVKSLTSESPSEPTAITARTRIDSLVIGGDVENARILVGYNRDEDPVNADARIGKVIVKGNWIASSLVAGIDDSTDDGFGRNDSVIAGDSTPSILSTIASVVIKGTATGSADADDHFGISAQQIGKLSISGAKVPLTKGTLDDILLDESNGDFRVVELG